MNIENGLINGVVFIDLKKAFDAIDHQIILQNLKNYGIDENSLTWFHSYLTDRTQKCWVNGQLSDSVPVACGVPQGSSLKPLLYFSFTLMIYRTVLIIKLQECLQTIQVLVMRPTQPKSSKLSLRPK